MNSIGILTGTAHQTDPRRALCPRLHLRTTWIGAVAGARSKPCLVPTATLRPSTSPAVLSSTLGPLGDPSRPSPWLPQAAASAVFSRTRSYTELRTSTSPRCSLTASSRIRPRVPTAYRTSDANQPTERVRCTASEGPSERAVVGSPRRSQALRVVESLGKVYKCHYPHRPVETARGVRLSPLHERLKAQGAYFRDVSGWEGADWYDLT
jgi:hypothetical protein